MLCGGEPRGLGGDVHHLVAELLVVAADLLDDLLRAADERGAALDFEHAHQLAVIGDEATVTAELERYRDSGATELLVTQTGLGGPDDRQRTLELLGSLAADAARPVRRLCEPRRRSNQPDRLPRASTVAALPDWLECSGER